MKYRLLFRFVLIMMVMAVIYARPMAHPPRLMPTGLDCMSDAKILFSSNRDGDDEIYLMDSDGSHVTQLTHNTGIAEYALEWNRIQHKVLYLSNFVGINRFQVYSMNLDGSDSTRLTSYPGFHADASWSPHGQELVLDYFEAGGHDIYKLVGEDYIRLTDSRAYTGPDSRLDDKKASFWLPANASPVWSPDGQQIAFSSSRDGNYEIYLMNKDGSNPTRLTDNLAMDIVWSWSPDGQQLAFSSDREGDEDIYVMNKEGTNLVLFVQALGDDNQPMWSPDGQKMLFTSDRDGDREIFVINLDGTNLTQLTYNVVDKNEVMIWTRVDDSGASWVTFRACNKSIVE